MNQNASDRIYRVDLTDAAGVVHASFEKTIHIRHKIPDSGGWISGTRVRQISQIKYGDVDRYRGNHA